MGNKSRFGYKPKTYELIWADGPYEGLVVEAKSPSIGELAQIVGLAGEMEALGDTADMGAIAGALPGFARVFELFGDQIVSWNLEVDGEPAEPSGARLASMDLDLGLEIVKRWIEAVTQVAPPLPGGSNSGPSSEPPGPVPMAPLSDRPPS